MAAGADILRLVRKGIDVGALHAHTRKPFRFYLCGDPALVSEFRSLLLSGHDETVPLDAAACLETVIPDRPQPVLPNDGRAIFFLGRRGNLAGAETLLHHLNGATELKLTTTLASPSEVVLILGTSYQGVAD